MVGKGTLYGVGVGPGDPELMTVKASRIVAGAPVVAYLAAPGKASTARGIASSCFSGDAIELALEVPMLSEREPAQAAYDRAAAAIAGHLDRGLDVAMLCEGDPFFYGSFMYLFARLAKTHRAIVVPGVTSITAAAAAIGRPLAARDEVLKIVPATLDAERLSAELVGIESAAIIKVGRHFGKVRSILADLDLVSRAVAIENATNSLERVRPVADVEGEALPYFTTILVYAGRERW